jgi:Flp pilus assembly protein TadD
LIRRVSFALVFATAVGAATLPACKKDQPAVDLRVAPTCASLEVLHAGVSVRAASGAAQSPRVQARVETEGRVRTTAEGRAIVRTDDGLELRLAGDTEVSFPDGHPRVERGRVFVTAWGDDERSLAVGTEVTLGLGDAAVEAERTPSGEVRVITVRGEVGWRSASAQGRLAQGEALSGQGSLAVRPAAVWDDWTGGAASPQGAAQRGALGAGEALIHAGDGEAPTVLAVNEHRVNVSVEGDVAITTVSQRFFNGSDQTAPVEYRVRLPEGAIVSGFSVEHGEYRIAARPGTVASLNRQGGVPALLASPEGGLYARLDALPPGQTVRCELQYVEWLVHEHGRRTYTYPMGDPVAPPFVGEFFFELSANHANVGALRGPAGSQLLGTQRLRFARSDFRPRADFHVELLDERPPESPSARVWLSDPTHDGGERYALVDVTVPPAPEQGSDLVVVVDDSAAMDGGTLSIASAAVDAILHQLGPNDRIALMFGDLRSRPAAGIAGQLLPASPARREAILDAIARARPGGATNLQGMLADAYAQLDPRRNGAVIYLGDGMPTMGALDPARLVDETLRVAPDLRLYVVALGNDAHPEVLAPLAARGGLVVRAGDQAEAVSAALRLAAHAMRPVLRDVVIDVGPTVAHPLPSSIEQWVAGEPLRVVGELTGGAPRTIRVRARQGGEVRTWTLAARVDGVNDAGDIRRRWGLARIRALELSGASRGALADLGVRFGLVTPMSALVLGAGAGGADGDSGYEVAGSLWPDPGLRSRLPHLGVSDRVEPRGVRTLYEDPEHPMVTDDESGWSRHYVGETGGVANLLELALAAAEPDARACVERARTLRPGLTGSITIAAAITADGHVSNATVTSSSLRDAGAEACIRRAVASLTVPAPSLLGVTPGTVSRTFDFYYAPTPRRGRTCPPTSRLARAARLVLWRERLGSNPGQAESVWRGAAERCELRVWEDRAALLDLIVRVASTPTELSSVRALLDDDAAAYFTRAIARRFGPSQVWRAFLASQGYINWDAFVRRVENPNLPLDRKIELARAYQQLAPHDIDVRLRLMALYEQAGRMREARHVAEGLRREPWADARVRALVGEMLLRAGDRDEGLRAFSEIAEWAPYDTNARARLGDLLLTYGRGEWAHDAYLQYQTLAALRPGDPLPRVRMALAALAAHREDEALRILRAVAEDTGGDTTAQSVEALLASEVARLSAARPDDGAVQGWVRVARLLRIARDGGVVAQWSHPDVALELRAQQSGDTEFVSVGEPTAPLNVRVFSPGPALEGSRLLVRASAGLAGARSVTAHLAVVQPDERGPRLVERDVTLTAGTRVAAFVVRGGALVPDTAPLPPTEVPVTRAEMY